MIELSAQRATNGVASFPGSPWSLSVGRASTNGANYGDSLVRQSENKLFLLSSFFKSSGMASNAPAAVL